MGRVKTMVCRARKTHRSLCELLWLHPLAISLVFFFFISANLTIVLLIFFFFFFFFFFFQRKYTSVKLKRALEQAHDYHVLFVRIQTQVSHFHGAVNCAFIIVALSRWNNCTVGTRERKKEKKKKKKKRILVHTR